MPGCNLDVTVTHGCCQRRAFRRRTCACLCHTVEVTSYPVHEPTAESYSHTRLRWLVTGQHHGRTVGLVSEIPGGGYSARGGNQVGRLAVTEEPWQAVLVLARWAQT